MAESDADRRTREARNERIRTLSAAGKSEREIAPLVDLSRSGVWYVLNGRGKKA